MKFLFENLVYDEKRETIIIIINIQHGQIYKIVVQWTRGSNPSYYNRPIDTIDYYRSTIKIHPIQIVYKYIGSSLNIRS